MPSVNKRVRAFWWLCGAYWLLLALVGLGPIVVDVIRAVNGPAQSSVGVSFGNGALSITVTRAGNVIHTASMHFLTLALWLAGPPLAAWLAMFATARRRDTSPVA